MLATAIPGNGVQLYRTSYLCSTVG